MGKVTIQEYTTKYPLTMIGEQAGICWGSNISEDEKNIKRAIECILNNHGRTMEFPDVYLILDGYSARVCREWYTHIGGSPTRLQASTRYINYTDFPYVIPPKIDLNEQANKIYTDTMKTISDSLNQLIEMGIPKEDASMLLPLGMETKVVCKHNLRNLFDMSHQRMCMRAYWEYRELFNDLCIALMKYSPQWKEIVLNCFKPKCEYFGYCNEKYSCGKCSIKKDNDWIQGN